MYIYIVRAQSRWSTLTPDAPGVPSPPPGVSECVRPRIWTSLPITHRLCLGNCWSLTIRTRCTRPNISLSLSLSLFVFLIQELINFSKSLAFAIKAKRDTHRHHTHHLACVRMHHKASL